MNERESWECAIGEHHGRVLILDETNSTQDAAITNQLHSGDVCGALLQTHGRGRRGKRWVSSGGVAMTAVVKHCTDILSIAVAGVLAKNLSNLIPSHSIGIKWPNDLFVDGKKLSGILIEHRNGVCLVGVGVNVFESPAVQEQAATSLISLGYEGDRAAIAAIVVSSVFEATLLDNASVILEWRNRDILVGTRQRVLSSGTMYEGIVLDIDPCQHLLLETSTGIITLQSAVSSILPPL